MAAVEVEGLVKLYGGRAVVDGLSLHVETGEIMCILGPNGAGKTTTVEILEGLRRPDGGRFRVLGVERPPRARIGVMPQAGRLYARIKPFEAVRQFAAFYDEPLPCDEVLAMVGLEGPALRTPFRRLSGGEQQRLSLALALVGRPELAFLDEPTAGMDAHARAATWDLVRGLRSQGRTVLLTTHLLDEAERLSDRVAILHRGRLVALGTPDELRGSTRGVRFRTRPGVDVSSLPAVEERPGEYTAPDADPARVATWLSERGEPIVELSSGAASLEDVFLRLTRE